MPEAILVVAYYDTLPLHHFDRWLLLSLTAYSITILAALCFPSVDRGADAKRAYGTGRWVQYNVKRTRHSGHFLSRSGKMANSEPDRDSGGGFSPLQRPVHLLLTRKA